MRFTAVGGAVASLALLGCLFLRWIEVDKVYAERIRVTVREEILKPGRAPTAAAKDYARLADTLAAEGGFTGVDLWLWTRTARGYASEIRTEASGADAAYRRTTVAAILLGMVAVGSLLLLGYFLGHRLHRARTPALILAMIVGSAALVLAGLHDHLLKFAAVETSPGAGFHVLLVGGAALSLAGIFGVTAHNWWRVYGGALVTGAALIVSAWGYLVWGIQP